MTIKWNTGLSADQQLLVKVMADEKAQPDWKPDLVKPVVDDMTVKEARDFISAMDDELRRINKLAGTIIDLKNKIKEVSGL